MLTAYIATTRAECAKFVDAGEFRGEPTTGYSTSKDAFFALEDGAIQTRTIGQEPGGLTLHIIRRHYMLCAGAPMNDQCGSSGCTYTLIARDQKREIRGGEPQIATVFEQNILLIPTDYSNCGASSIETLCLEAWTWDQRAGALVANTVDGPKIWQLGMAHLDPLKQEALP